MNTKQINAANADELMEQREQSQACLGYAESSTNCNSSGGQRTSRKSKLSFAHID